MVKEPIIFDKTRLMKVDILNLEYSARSFSRMGSRRILVLKLGSRRRYKVVGIAKCPRRVGYDGESVESKIVAKYRIIVIFFVSLYQRINDRRDPRDRGRETQNCRHFWIRLRSSRLKNINNLRYSGNRDRKTQNCRHFWIRLGSSRLKSVNSRRDRGGRGRETQNCRHFWTRI